ncbi:MAG: hypothetical protein ACRC2T_13560 [Thermoguttaceae bacterium]
MENEFKHVRQGDPLVIPASTYNAMLDAAQAVRNRNIMLSPPSRGFDSLYIHISNDTGIDLYKFDVVGLAEPMETGDDGTIIFSGVIPQKAHRGKFAILQADAPADAIVRACVHGVTFARLYHEGTKEPTNCDIIDGNTSWLKSRGTTEVLWSQPDTAERWAVIRIGGGSGGGTIFTGKVTEDIKAGLDDDNPKHGGMVLEDEATGEQERAFAGLLEGDETIPVDTRVEWVNSQGVNRIINARCL